MDGVIKMLLELLIADKKYEDLGNSKLLKSLVRLRNHEEKSEGEVCLVVFSTFEFLSEY